MVVILTLLVVGLLLFSAGIVLPLVIRGSAATTARGEVPSEHASLDVVIAAYLEAGTIAGTVIALRESLTEHWPGPFGIRVVASDDATFAAAEGVADVCLRVDREGKPAAVNRGIETSDADIVLLTDANCALAPADWPALLRESLGELRLVSANKTETTGREQLFWKLEAAIKASATSTSRTLSVVGEFLAMRRSDFRPIPHHVLDDLWLAMNFDARGLSVGVDTRISTLEPPANPREQWERRVRIAAGQLGEALPHWSSLASTPAGLRYLLHKMFRLTLGAIGFWIAVIALSLVWLPWTLLVIPVTAFSVLQYAGVIRIRSPLDPVFAVVGMQAVPFVGAMRAIRRSSVDRANFVGWRKVPR